MERVAKNDRPFRNRRLDSQVPGFHQGVVGAMRVCKMPKEQYGLIEKISRFAKIIFAFACWLAALYLAFATNITQIVVAVWGLIGFVPHFLSYNKYVRGTLQKRVDVRHQSENERACWQNLGISGEVLQMLKFGVMAG
jgi:hypothetical protein